MFLISSDKTLCLTLHFSSNNSMPIWMYTLQMRSLIETKKFLHKIFMFVADNEREFTCLHVQIVEPYQTNYCCQFKSYLSLNKLRLFVYFGNFLFWPRPRVTFNFTLSGGLQPTPPPGRQILLLFFQKLLPVFILEIRNIWLLSVQLRHRHPLLWP